ncbi:MAG: hypothetical protein AABX28_01545 [Nanoarchaeota archaeon]
MKTEELRDKIYGWSLDLVNEGKELEGIFLLLATWNFAYFRYHMKEFPLSEFEKSLKECNFDYFKDKIFSEINLEDTEVKNKIIEIYGKLSNFKGIRWVGATKIMHLKSPNFFIMWDRNIIKHYQAKTFPEGYFNFMKLMQNLYKSGFFGNLGNNITIPRAIDLFNMDKFSP